MGLTLFAVTPVGGTPPSGRQVTFEAKYELEDTKSRRRTVASYEGKVQLLFFGFTHCPEVCPSGLAKISSALSRLEADETSSLQPIFVSIDPERDTPQVIESYLSGYSADWVGLRGTSEATKRALRDFRVLSFRNPTDHQGHYSMTHTSLVYAVGRNGQGLGTIDTSAEVSELVSAMRRWLES